MGHRHTVNMMSIAITIIKLFLCFKVRLLILCLDEGWPCSEEFPLLIFDSRSFFLLSSESEGSMRLRFDDVLMLSLFGDFLALCDDIDGTCSVSIGF